MVFVGWGATPAARFPQYEEVAFEERSPLGVPFSFAAAQAQPNTGVGLLYEKASLTLRPTQTTIKALKQHFPAYHFFLLPSCFYDCDLVTATGFKQLKLLFLLNSHNISNR